MNDEELRRAIFALKLKGHDNVLFYDRSMINTRELQSMSEGWPEEAVFGAIFIGVHVAPGKTLRGCVMKRNPIIAKAIGIWERLNEKLHASQLQP